MSANATLEPPNHDAVRQVVEARLEAAKGQGGVLETLPVEWRGQQLIIPVITMPVELLYYNPNTHRIRAQMTVDPVRYTALTRDPFGNTAQRYLHNLLAGDPADPAKEDPTFGGLKDDLKQHGQTDAGIITQNGILINGNTRCAALRDLNIEHIRVGVLPPDAGIEDLQSIELSLQLRRDHKRDYSFMNFLLAIDDRRKAGRPPASIQKDFRIRADSYERAVWILDFVRATIERSSVTLGGGGKAALSLIDFEGDQGKLEELWRAYVTLKRKSPDDAEALREQRLLGLIAGGSKTDLRLIEPNFADLYLEKVVPTTTHTPAAPKVVPGTNIPVPAENPKVAALRSLADQVLQATAIEKAQGGATTTEIKDAAASAQKIRAAVKNGLEQAGRNGRIIKKRFGPVERLSDANEDLALCIKAVAESKGTGNFIAEDLDAELRETMTHLSKLAQMIGTSPGEDCDGVNWLLQAGRVKPPGT